ncbi:fumarate/nitrate reduction transcriptional regulator Fnr [Marinicella sp. W31]|uniref:fumarate/nitrate reduction transcriptional regulator Fnr n=1 Tax=Marinicella sp. W31 TaxID=3023713 RepID=UPI0037572C95
MAIPSIKCQNCGINQLCLPVMLADAEVEHLDGIVQRTKPLDKGSILYRVGDTFNAIYAVRSGCLKSYTISENGDEQIIGFHLPGEIIGLNAIDSQQHPSTAKALETSTICTLPYEDLDSLAADMPGLRQQLMRIMSREILDDQELLFLLNKKSADERLAAFLINLSARYAKRGLANDCFKLVMKKSDIANYLGMAIETISRLFSRLVEKDYITIERKQVNIIDMNGLSQLAGVSCHL